MMGDYQTLAQGAMEIIPPEGPIIPPKGCIIQPEGRRRPKVEEAQSGEALTENVSRIEGWFGLPAPTTYIFARDPVTGFVMLFQDWLCHAFPNQ